MRRSNRVAFISLSAEETDMDIMFSASIHSRGNPLRFFMIFPNNPCLPFSILLLIVLLNTLLFALSPAILCSNAIKLPNFMNVNFHEGFMSLPLRKPRSINMTEDERFFWAQPESLGYKPCLTFSERYRNMSINIVKQRRRYLLVVVSGGLNQQRNQIIDAVVIARILDATLVVPIMQVNVIWGDQSEFSDIFDVEHFKRALKDDVRVVSSLPSTHITTMPVVEKHIPIHVTEHWIRSRYYRRLNREGVLLLRGLNSRVSKDLSPDLQKLRCKVAFEALRFAAPIEALGNKLAERMHSNGPYMALHLRLEKDVWVRTGCLPGLGPEYDKIVEEERKLHPNLLTGKTNLTYPQRKKGGLCPLNASEVFRLLKALGASKRTNIYWAGGEPMGGKKTLEVLTHNFPEFYNKDSVSSASELAQFANKSSIMAALDYIVALQSDVFMASHGGNMGRALQGHRAYSGHKKHIVPNKRSLVELWAEKELEDEKDIIRGLHEDSMGRPILREKNSRRDVIAYPVPECMCQSSKYINDR